MPSAEFSLEWTLLMVERHSANDTLDKIDPVQLKQNVAAWVAMVRLAAPADVPFA